MRRKALGRTLLLGVLAVGAVAGALRLRARSAPASAPYLTATVKRGSLTATVSATGSLTPVQVSELTAVDSGIVQGLTVQAGQTVHQGQVLARIDDAGNLSSEVLSMEQTLASDQMSLASERPSTSRADSLHAAQLQVRVDQANLRSLRQQQAMEHSPLTRELALAQVQIDKQNLIQLRQERDDLTLTAPDPGQVEQIDVKPGDHVTEGEVLMEVGTGVTNTPYWFQSADRITSPVDGTVASIPVHTLQWVRGDQNVVVLTDPGLNAQVLLAKERLHQDEASVASGDYAAVTVNAGASSPASTSGSSTATAGVAANSSSAAGSATQQGATAGGASVPAAAPGPGGPAAPGPQAGAAAGDPAAGSASFSANTGGTSPAATSDTSSAVAGASAAPAGTASAASGSTLALEILKARESLQQDESTVASLVYGQETPAQAEAALMATKVGEDRRALASLQAEEAHLTVRSPFTGVVESLSVQNGASVNKGATLLTVADEAQLRLDMSIDELDVDRVHVGQTVTVTIDALAGKRFSGHVASLSRVGSSSNGRASFAATVVLSRPQGADVGMTAEANIDVASVQQALLVPVEAIHTEGGKTVVVVAHGGAFRTVPIKTGLVNASDVQVLSGLQAGDVVVTSALGSGQATSGPLNLQGKNLAGPGGPGGPGGRGGPGGPGGPAPGGAGK